MIPLWATAERLQRAREHYRQCLLCEHRCAVDRTSGPAGKCKAGAVPRVFRHRVEYGDEQEIAPSYLIYLSGCDLRCAFCINELNAFDPRRGRPLTHEFFDENLAKALRQGARTLQWVGGEPTIHLPGILDVMAACPDLPRVVWKTDMHATPEALDLLTGVVDVFLADFKFGNDECARRIAGIESYCTILTRNLLLAAERADLIVRHLMLPGHHDCCTRPIVEWMHDNLPETKLSLRDGYLPHWQANQHVELGRPLAPQQAASARNLALQAGLNLIE